MDGQSWKSEFGFIMAASGAAVGLGNIWSFPRCAAKGGGLVFLAVYLLLNLLVGYPLLMGELAVGRDSRSRPVGAFKALGTSGFGGVLGQLASLLMMSFYSVLGGCCIRYMIINFMGIFSGGEGAGLSLFLGYISNVPLSAAFTVLFIALAMLVIMAGVSAGLEQFAKIAMPLLIFMLPGLIICSLSLPGAADGMKSLTVLPELDLKGFGEISAAAFVQMFFSLSLGQAVMLTYGSYLPKEIHIPKCAAAVMITDILVAVLASFAVLPAAHAAGGDAGEGAMMLFVTMQTLFAAYGAWGSMFGFLFYLLVLLAALTSAVSLLEVISFFAGEGAGRKSSAIFAGALTMIPAVAVARDGMGFGALPEIFGRSWMDAAEFISEGLLMPLCAFLMVRSLASPKGETLLRRQLGAFGGGFTRTVLRWVSPPLLAAVMLYRVFGI